MVVTAKLFAASLVDWAGEIEAEDEPRSQNHLPEYQLQLVGEVWHARFRCEKGDYHVKGNQALAWLAKLLAAPNRLLTVANLRGDPDGRLAADAMLSGQRQMDSSTIRDIKRRLEEIDAIAENAGGSERLDEEKMQLLRQITGPTGKILESQLRGDHRNIATQLRSLTRKKLKKEMPQLSAYLQASLKLELPEFGYYPPAPTPAWQI